jgi:proline iminopeptidase
MKLLVRIVAWIAAAMVGMVVVLGVALAVLRWRNEARRRIESPPGIDRLVEYRIGGINQWVHIRGRDPGNPIVLYLHGGPGAPMMPYGHLFQDAWERGFTVVQWDQRGAGKTALSNDPRLVNPTIDFDRMKADAVELSAALARELGQRKILLLGHSWGTILGIPVAQEHPELFCGFVGTGVVINIQENEQVGYGHTLDEAHRRRDSVAVRELEGLAPYPEATRNVPKEMILRKWQVAYGFARAKYRTLRAAERGRLLNALTSPVYRLSDLRVFWSPEWTNHAYDKVGTYLMHHDARAWGLTFPIPLFFFVGRDDWQTPGVVAKAYFDEVTAPYKEFRYVAGAAHATPVEQPGAFAELMLRHVRPIALQYGCGRPVTAQ